MYDVKEYGVFAGFPNGDWKSATATPRSLLAVVTDLRKLLKPRADYLRNRLLEGAPRAERQLPGVWVSLENRLTDWRRLLLALTDGPFRSFLEIALADPDHFPDPAWWAHAQIHSFLGGELGAFDAPGVGSGVRFLPIRNFVKEYCTGAQQVDPEADYFKGSLDDPAVRECFKQFLFRENWRAPRGLGEYRAHKSTLEPTRAWEPMGEAETERLLVTIASDFWLAIEVPLENRARQVRVALACSGIPKSTAAVSEDAAGQSQRDTQVPTTDEEISRADAAERKRPAPLMVNKAAKAKKLTKGHLALAAIKEVWDAHPGASYKTIAQVADESKVPTPWNDCPSWSAAMAKREGAFKTLLGKARGIAKRVSN